MSTVLLTSFDFVHISRMVVTWFVIGGCSKILGETKNLLVCSFATHALEKMFVGRRNTNLSKNDVTPIN